VNQSLELALQDQVKDLSLSTIQRRFLRATGVTQSTARQIERARFATLLLPQGPQDAQRDVHCAEMALQARSMRSLFSGRNAKMALPSGKRRALKDALKPIYC
jgi:hypothetical protein